MGWVYVVLAGIFEVCFATALSASNGFTRLVPSLLFLLCGGISFFLLTRALTYLPIGTAYSVWVGIGAVGTVAVGIVFYNEPADFWRLFFITLLVVSIIGLKFVS